MSPDPSGPALGSRRFDSGKVLIFFLAPKPQLIFPACLMAGRTQSAVAKGADLLRELAAIIAGLSAASQVELKEELAELLQDVEEEIVEWRRLTQERLSSEVVRTLGPFAVLERHEDPEDGPVSEEEL